MHLRVDREASQTIVTVTGNGIDIATGSMPQLFDMFSQVSEAAELSEGGLDARLDLAKRLAEKHGGSVEVSSPGEGRRHVHVAAGDNSPHRFSPA
ncbi:MAG: hypothetical protein V7642_4751 [Burkholderiales bacterium]|jgi:signal transduction histidine kinase